MGASNPLEGQLWCSCRRYYQLTDTLAAGYAQIQVLQYQFVRADNENKLDQIVCPLEVVLLTLIG